MTVENMVNVPITDFSGIQKTAGSKLDGQASKFEKILNQQKGQKNSKDQKDLEEAGIMMMPFTVQTEMGSQETIPNMDEMANESISQIVSLNLPEMVEENMQPTMIQEAMQVAEQSNASITQNDVLDTRDTFTDKMMQTEQNTEGMQESGLQDAIQTLSQPERKIDTLQSISEKSDVSQVIATAEKKQPVKADAQQTVQNTVTQEQVVHESSSTIYQMQDTEPAASSDISPKYMELIKENISTQIASGKQEIQIQLNPVNLGKLTVKATYEAGKTMIAIVCSTDKTMQAMSMQAKDLAAMLEERTGQTTQVVVDKPEADYLQQQSQQQQGQGHQNQESQSEQKTTNQNEFYESFNFLEQLRLGLA